MVEVLLGFGGNLGDAAASIEAALLHLDRAGVRLRARSALYRTPPWGPVAQPDFVNLCTRNETDLAPHALLDVTSAIETRLGRERSLHWGPRTIDIDILAYGDRLIDAPDLQIPHPRMTERAFVLVPLIEIAPEWIIRGRSVGSWAADVDQSGMTRIDIPR